jgi:hypothetical protein
MRPDPARLPVRRSTNNCQPMLLGPQRYAVARVAVCQRCEWYPECCIVACSRAHARAQNCWDRSSADRGVNYLTPHSAAIGFEECFAVCDLRVLQPGTSLFTALARPGQPTMPASLRCGTVCQSTHHIITE